MAGCLHSIHVEINNYFVCTLCGLVNKDVGETLFISEEPEFLYVLNDSKKEDKLRSAYLDIIPVTYTSELHNLADRLSLPQCFIDSSKMLLAKWLPRCSATERKILVPVCLYISSAEDIDGFRSLKNIISFYSSSKNFKIFQNLVDNIITAQGISRGLLYVNLFTVSISLLLL